MSDAIKLAKKKKALAEKKSREKRKLVHKITISAFDDGSLTVDTTKMNTIQFMKILSAGMNTTADQMAQNAMAQEAMEEKEETRIILPN